MLAAIRYKRRIFVDGYLSNKRRILRWRLLGILLMGLVVLAPVASAQQLYTSLPTVDAEGAEFFGSLLDYSFTLREGFDSNVFGSQIDPQESFYTNIAGGAVYEFGSDRLRLSAGATAGLTYYYTRPGQKYDISAGLALGASYKLTPRLQLTYDSNSQYVPQPQFDVVGASIQPDQSYFYSSHSLRGRYQWTPKFSTVTGYNFTLIAYQEQSVNDALGRIDQTLSQAFDYLILPKTTIVAEYRANPVDYFQADLDTFGNFLLVGFDQIFNPRFFWTLRAGAEQRFLNNQTDGRSNYIGPFGESRVTYKFGPASNISWFLRYGTEPGNISGVTIATTFRSSLSVSHAFTARITGEASINFISSYYDQANVIPDYTQNTYNFTLGAKYAIKRWWLIEIGYSFIQQTQTVDLGGEYNRNIAFIGTQLQF